MGEMVCDAIGRSVEVLERCGLGPKADQLASRLPLLLESVIHRYVGVAEATAMKKGVVENPVAGSATFDFMKLFNELKREMKNEQEKHAAAESNHR